MNIFDDLDKLNFIMPKISYDEVNRISILLIVDGVRCVAFKPNDDTIFLIGTDEGLIYKCTTEYSSKFLNTYKAHDTPIYNIVWNTYIPDIFMTCAAEWHIKIWDHDFEYEYMKII